MIFVGIIIGFLFWKLIAGKHEGDKIERSFRFSVKNYYIHIHHWILVSNFTCNFLNCWVFKLFYNWIFNRIYYPRNAL
jgi:hypothetical protein